jgi:hypothetical protein
MKANNSAKQRLGAALLAGTCAYVAALGAMVGFEEAGATLREIPSSICHAETDTVGTTLKNSGLMTYTGTGTRSIFCPYVSDDAQAAPDVTGLAIHGVEGTDGAISRTCSCYLNPAACACSTGTHWSNNAGVVVQNLSASEWRQDRETEFAYLLHTLTANSVLAGMVIEGRILP